MNEHLDKKYIEAYDVLMNIQPVLRNAGVEVADDVLGGQVP